MRWQHLAEILPLERALFGRERWTAAMFWSELIETATRDYRVVLDAAGHVVGYVGLCIYGRAPRADAWIQTIAVAPGRQGNGIGSAMLDTMTATAMGRGASTLCLEVSVDNGRAQRLYARHGFEAVGIRPGYYQPSNTDALTMCRELSGQ